MAWFKKTRKPIASQTAEKPSRVPEGLWVKCPGCAQLIYNKDLETSLNVCPKCAHHFRIGAAERLASLFDDGKYDEHFPNLISTDPLQFVDTKPYRDRLQKTREATGLKDSVIVATGRLWAWSRARRSRAHWNWHSRINSQRSSSRAPAARA
jgi:acetyl-CoA carboxylase carboxyl transferase subunit beta